MEKNQIAMAETLARQLIGAANVATKGTWCAGSGYLYAPDEANANDEDTDYYGGKLVCESVQSSADLLFMSLAQPQNVSTLARALLTLIGERRKEERGRELERDAMKDNVVALSQLRDSACSAIDRLNNALKGLER